LLGNSHIYKQEIENTNFSVLRREINWLGCAFLLRNILIKIFCIICYQRMWKFAANGFRRVWRLGVVGLITDLIVD
jgi:hypothetical protein